MTMRNPVMTRSYYSKGEQHLETVWQINSNEFEVESHASGANGGPGRHPVTI